MMKTQICIKCGKEKPLDEFNKKRSSLNGFDNRCRECVREYMKIYMRKSRRILRLPSHPLLKDGVIVDGKFAGCQPQELIEELKRLGFKGMLRYVSLQENEVEI